MTETTHQLRDPRLTSVYSGPAGVAATQRAILEGAGFLVFTPGENTKILDPFITGANCLEVSVQVPSTDAAAAREYLASLRVDDAAAATGGDSADESGEEWADESGDDHPRLEQDVHRVVLRMKWALAFQLYFVFLPIPLFLVPRYVRLVGRMDALPPEHATACTVFLASLALGAVYPAFWAAVFFGWL